jgi:hypothetical protein
MCLTQFLWGRNKGFWISTLISVIEHLTVGFNVEAGSLFCTMSDV